VANEHGIAVESLANLVTEKTMEVLIATYVLATTIVAAYSAGLAIASRRTSRQLHELRSAEAGEAQIFQLKNIA
jgi:hypothetical protein